MRELLLSLELVALGAVVLVLALLVVVVRRRRLSGRLGSFDCALRRPAGRSGRWSPGVARYETARLDWYRTFSFLPRPSSALDRGALDVVLWREAAGPEAVVLPPGVLVVECRHRGEDLHLAMTHDAYTGFASWLESSPPGQNVNVA